VNPRPNAKPPDVRLKRGGSAVDNESGLPEKNFLQQISKYEQY
jgi:hypothetical protein